MRGMRGSARLAGLLLALTVAACAEAVAPGSVRRDGDRVAGTGTVAYFAIEGGFFAIRGDDQKTYDPINLPDAFREDGLRIRFTARVRSDMGSIHMVGEIVELERIERL